MHLRPLYHARFETPRRWTVALGSPPAREHHNLLFARGRCEGRITASLRATNFPRSRADGVLLPDFRGVLETDDGATILFEWQGFGITADDGVRRLVGAATHLSDDDRYRWLNSVACPLAGTVEPRDEGSGFDVLLEVTELVWEPPVPAGDSTAPDHRVPR